LLLLLLLWNGPLLHNCFTENKTDAPLEAVETIVLLDDISSIRVSVCVIWPVIDVPTSKSKHLLLRKLQRQFL
jgi:hypothetical protein